LRSGARPDTFRAPAFASSSELRPLNDRAAHRFRHRARFRGAAGAVKDVLVALVLWALWQVPVYAFLEMPPRLGMPWLIAVAAFFLWCHAAPGGWGTPRGRATGRVRRVPAGAWPLLAALAPVMSAGALSMWVLLGALGAETEGPLPRQIVEYGERPGGALVLLVLIVGIAPLIEELAFRGWMQRPLERRLGPAPAIVLTALVFALAHLQPDGIPIRLAGGAALGYAVWATRSIWSGVALHVAWNAGVLLFGLVFPRFTPAEGGWGLAGAAAAALTASAAAFVVVGRRLRPAVNRPGR
jgi:membrane protease YdiL (CAAX protease family)